MLIPARMDAMLIMIGCQSSQPTDDECIDSFYFHPDWGWV